MLLGLLSLEGKGNWEQTLKADCNSLACRERFQISSQTPLYPSQCCCCASVNGGVTISSGFSGGAVVEKLRLKSIDKREI